MGMNTLQQRFKCIYLLEDAQFFEAHVELEYLALLYFLKNHDHFKAIKVIYSTKECFSIL